MVLFALFSLTSCRVIPLVIFYLLTPNLQIMDHLIDIALFLWILCSFWRVSLVSWKQRTEFPLFSLSFYAYVPPGRHQHQLAEIKILSVLFWNKKKLVISKSLKILLFLRKLSVSITDANNGFDMHSLRIKENRDQARIGTNSTQMVNWFLKNLQQFLDFIHNCFNVFI